MNPFRILSRFRFTNRKAPAGRGVRPRLELLEDRTVMSAACPPASTTFPPAPRAALPDRGAGRQRLGLRVRGRRHRSRHPLRRGDAVRPAATRQPAARHHHRAGRQPLVQRAGRQQDRRHEHERRGPQPVHADLHPQREHRMPGRRFQRQLLVQRIRREQDRQIRPSTGAFTQYAVPTPGGGPAGLVIDGNYVWFTEYNKGKIGRLDASTGAIVEFPTSNLSSQPWDMTDAPDSDLVHRSDGKQDRPHRPQRPHHRVRHVRPQRRPVAITAGPDGDIWFSENGTNQVGA